MQSTLTSTEGNRVSFHDGRSPGGRGYELRTEQWLPRPLSEVFDFFADAGNLQILTPDWLDFSILTPRPVDMRIGALIDYRLRLRKIPVRWQSEITAWDPPHRFIDEQRRGPYKHWIHEHTFAEKDGGTLVRDHVRYDVPGGALVHRTMVGPDLRRIFRYRQEKLAALFGAK